ncbi:MAG: TIGR02710 family CRISPR-associated protein [Methanobrevibacter sp.]|jgi:CRISPR-associated protein (TIGR02710 family)|nr:TIGR02710 family CRISPR-associated protein [Candidatus Methanoflexus mossambicus]
MKKLLFMSVGKGITVKPKKIICENCGCEIQKGKTDNHYGRNDQVKGIIFTIKEYKPDCVYFFTSKESKDTVDLVKNEFYEIYHKPFDEIYNSNFVILSDVYNFDSCYVDIQRVFEKYSDCEIAVSPLGGTNPMASCMSLWAGVFNKKILFAPRTLKNDNKNELEENKELKCKKPYEIQDKINDKINFEKFKDAFDSCNFELARSKLSDVKDLEYKSFLLNLIDFYGLWDKFDNKCSKKRYLNACLDSILSEFNNEKNKKIYFNFKNEFPKVIKQIEDNLNFLNKKIGDKNKDISNSIKFYLPDLLNNAKRRCFEGKYDDAVARLYRVSELIAQIKLVDLGLINLDSLKSNLSFILDKSLFKEKVGGFCSEQRFKKYAFKGREKTYELLEEEFGIKFSLGEERDIAHEKIISSRNTSILAHGLKPIQEHVAKKLFEDLVDYSKIIYPEIINDMDLAKFPKFNIE